MTSLSPDSSASSPVLRYAGGKRNAPVDPGKKEERKREDKKQGLSQFIPLSSFAEEYDGNNHNDCNHDDDKNRDEHAGDRT